MAAPQLRLEVSLNLAGFRGEIRKLTAIAQSEFVPQINIKFNRKVIANELQTLSRYVGNKKFNIVINTNLEGEINAADRLVTALGRVQRAASGAKGGSPLGVKQLSLTEKQGGFTAAQIKTLFGAAIQGGLLDEKTLGKKRDQMVAALGSIGRDSIAGLLNGLQSGNADLQKAAQMLGNSLISSLKVTLGIASPSREFKKIGEAAGQGFEQGLLSSMADAFDSLERQLGTKLQRLKAQAIAGTSGALAVSGRVSPVQVADVTPRDYARIAGSGPRAALPPGVDRSAETLQNFYRSLDQIGIALASTVDSAERADDAFKTLRNAIDSLINRAKVLTGEQSLQARLRPSSVLGGMPLLTGRAPSRALPMLSAAAQRPERFTSQEKLFKDFLGRTIKAVVPESGSAAIGRSLFGGTQFREIGNAMRRLQLGAGIDTSVETVAVKDLTIASRNIAAATNALQTQKLLPAAGQSNASRMTRSLFAGLPPIQAPSIGQENAPLSAGATRSLNKARQLLGMPIGLSSPLGSMGQFPMSGMIGRGSLGQFPVDPMLAVGGASAMGQKVAGPYPWSNTTRSARGGYIPGIRSSAFFPMSGMIGPSSPLGRITPQSSMFAGGGAPGGHPGGPPPPPRGGGGGGSFGGMQFNMPKLPGAGLVREIGTEFGFAAKQVLLFGTAYKALAFLQSFPGQVGAAVGALQSFRNTLNAISPTAQEAAASSAFILNIVDKYNVPLQSARDGFTKLYASMAPTGFSGNEIRDLFTGISQAAATFGMSSDKVDRVTYAFAQMASKGQVMSEELKGQLGDVLPGAMGIFAKAAGFEGADAIQKFGKALEDGAYKGKPMRDLLKNVTIELKKEFGPGAEGAARTYQGVMTRMANSTKLLYESFEPVAINFLNSIVVPITGGLKTVTDGFKAFFTGQDAQTTGGGAFAKQLEALRPAFEGIRSNITSLVPIFQSFGKILLATSQVFLQIAGNPFVGYLARVYLNVVALTTVFNILNLRALIPFVANLARSIYSVVAFGVQCTLAGQKAVFFDLMVRTLGTTLRTFFAATAVGIILVGIGLIAEAFVTAGARADAARQKMSQFADSVKQLGAVGDVAGATAEKVGQQSLAARLQSAKTLLQQVKSEGRKLTKDQVQELKNLQLTNNLDFVEVRRGPEKGLLVAQGKITDLLGTQSALQAEIDSAGRGYLETQTKIVQATKAVTVAQGVQRKQEKESQAAGSTAIDLTGGKDAKTKSLESYHSLQDQLAKAQTQGEIDRIQDAFDHRFNLINAAYDLEDARANSFQKATIAFQKELLAIEQRRQQSAIRAQAEVLNAQGSVAGGAPSAPALPPPSGGGGGAFDTGMRTGPSSAIGGSADYHQDIMFGSTVSMKERVQLMDQLARGYEKMGRAIEFSNAGVAGERYRSSMPYEAKSSLISRAQAAHANRPGGSGRAAMDFYAPLASSNRFGRSVEGQAMLAPSVEGASYSYGGGGRAGRTMTASRGGSMVYEQLHGSTAVPLQAKALAPVKASERREEVAAVTAAIAVRRESTLALNAEKMAAQETAIAYEKYVASIAPAAEQELQNSLLEKRIQLMNSGVTGDFLETQMKIFEAEEKTRIAGEMLDTTNAAQVKGYKRLQEALPGYIASLRDAAVAQEDLNFATAKSDLNKRKAMAGALTPDAELRVELAQKYPDNLARQEEEFSQTKLVQGMEKAKQDLQNIASSISNAFGEAFKGIVTGSMTAQEALAGFFQSVADSFADMVANMIAEYLKMALIKGIMSLIPGLGAAAGGLSSAFGSTGPSFNAGAFSGPALSPGAAFGGAGAGSFSGAFGGGAAAFNPAAFSIPKFANGGVVTGPTLGLVGEGRYNEAVIPLPDGKSVPVQLSGGDGGNQINSNITVNVSNGQAQSNATGSNSSELGRKIEGAVKQVIVGELRPGGLLASR